MASGFAVNWITSVLVYLESSFTFKSTFVSFVTNKAKFYMQAFNSIFRQIGRIASEEVVFALIKSKYLPFYFMEPMHDESFGMALFRMCS